jgi:hypothetical protein
MKHWYFAQDVAKHIRQVVVKLPSGPVLPSKFGSLFLPVDFYPDLTLQTWCAGFFATEDEGPFLMVRADESFENFREPSLSIAFTFCRFEAGGVIAVFVGIDSPMSSNTSPAGRVVESVTALDTDIDGAVDRIKKALNRDKIHMCVAGAGSGRSTIVDPNGRSIQMKPPGCKFDRIFPVEQAFRDALMKEFAELQKYHSSLSSTRRNARRCLDQFCTVFSKDVYPILPGSSYNVSAEPTTSHDTQQLKTHAAPEQPSEACDWYIARNNKQYGPYTLAKLRGDAATNTITRNDLVCCAGWKAWHPAGSVPVIFSPVTQRAPVDKSKSFFRRLFGVRSKSSPSKAPGTAVAGRKDDGRAIGGGAAKVSDASVSPSIKASGAAVSDSKKDEVVNRVVAAMLARQTAEADNTFETAGKNVKSIICSDDECPCTDKKPLVLGKDAYLYISPGVVNFRQDCLSLLELEMKVSRMKSPQDMLVAVANSMPKYICEAGSNRRGLDLSIALADGKAAAQTGFVPLRPTPKAPKPPRVPPPKPNMSTLPPAIAATLAKLGRESAEMQHHAQPPVAAQSKRTPVGMPERSSESSSAEDRLTLSSSASEWVKGGWKNSEPAGASDWHPLKIPRYSLRKLVEHACTDPLSPACAEVSIKSLAGIEKAFFESPLRHQQRDPAEVIVLFKRYVGVVCPKCLGGYSGEQLLQFTLPDTLRELGASGVLINSGDWRQRLSNGLCPNCESTSFYAVWRRTKKPSAPPQQVMPKVLWKVWYKHKAQAEKVVAHDPTGLQADLLVLLAHAENEGEITRAENLAVMDAVKRRSYAIVPATHNGNEGFDLIFFG